MPLQTGGAGNYSTAVVNIDTISVSLPGGCHAPSTSLCHAGATKSGISGAATSLPVDHDTTCAPTRPRLLPRGSRICNGPHG